MRSLGEELQRLMWKISEKDRELKILEEKEMGFMIKTTAVKSRLDDLKIIYDENQARKADAAIVQSYKAPAEDS